MIQQTIRRVVVACALSLTACGPIHCAQGIDVTRHRNPATGIWTVIARCGATVIAQQDCADGGARRRSGTHEALVCDGVDLIVYPAAAVTLVTQ